MSLRSAPAIPSFVLTAIFTLLMVDGCGRTDPGREAAARIEQALTQADAKKYGAALSLARQAFTLSSDAKLDSVAGESSLLMASCYRLLGVYDSALLSYQNAAQAFNRLSDQRMERKGRIALAQFYHVIKEDSSALSLAAAATGSAKVFADSLDWVASLRTLAGASHELGDYSLEVSSLYQLMVLDSALFRSRNEDELLGSLLHAFESQGQYDQARSVWQRWRKKASGDSASLAAACFAWGRAQLAFAYPDSALGSFSQALSFLSPQSDRSLRMPLLFYLGNIAFSSRHFENARLLYSDAANLAAQGDDIPSRQILQLMVIACDWKLNGPGSGEADLSHRCSGVLATCRQAGFSLGEAYALFLQARITEMGGDPSGAWFLYHEALGSYEQLTGEAPDVSTGSCVNSFLSVEAIDWYDPLLLHYCSQDKPTEAFEICERRNLRDINAFFRNLGVKTTSQKLNNEIASIQRKCHLTQLLEEDLLSELSAGRSRSPERVESLGKLLPLKKRELLLAAEQFERTSPEFTRLLFAPPLSLRQARDSLSAGTTLLEYVPASSAIYVLAVSKDSAYLRKTPIARTHIVSLIQEYNRLIGDPRLNIGPQQFNAGAAISRLNELSSLIASSLIDPILPLLKPALYVVPPRQFGWLPFHTLRLSGSPLITRFSVSYLPTAAALLFPPKREVYVADIIGIGHQGKTNWDVEYELKDIRGFYDKARMLFATSASISNLDTATYQLLQFASEFHLDASVPGRSATVLSDGKTVYGLEDVSLGEMLSFPPPQTLVFSNITPKPGELSRYAPLAFLANGTSTVVATMWQGERVAKKYFGEVFYTSIQTGQPASTAYQNAMVALAKSPRLSPLYRWGLYFRFGR